MRPKARNVAEAENNVPFLPCPTYLYFSQRAEFAPGVILIGERLFVATFDALSNSGKRPPLGRVTLVGAGPGDPELLTRKGYKALQKADVVFFDDLVSPDIIDILPETTRCIYVGKPQGTPHIAQEDISAQMIAAVRRDVF